MDIKMIVTDLDRTLLRSDTTISEYTTGVFTACRRRGIKIAFATARSENSCKRFSEIIRPDAIISNGGALVRIGDAVIYRAAMDAETAGALLCDCLNRPHVGYITADTDKGYFVNKPVDERDLGWLEYLPAYCVDFSKGLDGGAYKIAAEISDNGTAYAIASAFPTVNVVPFSGEGWFCFADRSADKWRGVKALAAHAGVDEKDIIAFGDDYGDIAMLRGCGVGVAVANAIGEVKAAADFICDSNDNDGVAKWLNALI